MTQTLAELESLIAKTVTIPTVPTTLADINAILDDPDGSASDAATVIVKDQAIATKVLRLANSAIYALKVPVSDIQHAVSILGLKVLRNLVLQATVLGTFDAEGGDGFDPARLWDHGFKAACAARSIALKSKVDFGLDREQAYTAGLLHDIGKILLLQAERDAFLDAAKRSRESSEPLHEVEEEVFSFHHAQVGGLLVSKWKLSPEVAAAVAHHHLDLVETDSDEARGGLLLAIANGIAHRVVERSPGYAIDEMSEELLAKSGLRDDELEPIFERVRDARIED